MKLLLISIIVLISINLSGCVVPIIVKNITEAVLEGKALKESQQRSATEFVDRYIAASNADNKVLIANMTTTEFTSEKKRQGYFIKLTGETTVLAEANVAVVWTSFSSTKDNSIFHCGTSSYQLVKDKDEWKMAYITWAEDKTACESSSTL